MTVEWTWLHFAYVLRKEESIFLDYLEVNWGRAHQQTGSKGAPMRADWTGERIHPLCCCTISSINLVLDKKSQGVEGESRMLDFCVWSPGCFLPWLNSLSSIHPWIGLKTDSDQKTE